MSVGNLNFFYMGFFFVFCFTRRLLGLAKKKIRSSVSVCLTQNGRRASCCCWPPPPPVLFIFLLRVCFHRRRRPLLAQRATNRTEAKQMGSPSSFYVMTMGSSSLIPVFDRLREISVAGGVESSPFDYMS